MGTKVVVHKNRTNVIPVELNMDITGETLTSEIRASDDHNSTHLATFTVAVVDAATGELTLTLDNTDTAEITVDSGFMDIKRVSGGEPLSVFDRPLEVEFRGTVTA